jgi:3-hydroxyisobutyrate dehydrogenase
MNITILGTGRMGGAIGERLIDQGHTLVLWNRSADKTLALTKRGATLASSPALAVEKADVVISVLTDARAIESTYSSPKGVLSAQIKGKLFIDMSTVRPQTGIDLGAQLKAAGAAFIECPVGGTVGPARDGKLLGLAGGSTEDFERAKPLLDQLCRRVEHVGELGSGASMKLAINLPLLVYWQALGEALALAERSGLSPEKMIDILSDTSGTPAIMKMRAPAVVSALKGEPSTPAHFNIDSIRKDLRTMIEEGTNLGFELPAAQAALGAFNKASDAGLGELDGTQLAAWWIRQAKSTAKATH